MNSPSDLNFAALLQYSPRGQSTTSKQSREVMRAIKNDSLFGTERAIERAAKRLRTELPNYSFLNDCFSPQTLLVPVPRSAPLVQGGLWPTLRLCQAFEREGFATTVQPLLTRVKAVPKSATAGPGQRPGPEAHYDSLGVDSNIALLAGSRGITIVDDVVTRGATLLACYVRLREVYPQTPIYCFGLIRTVSAGELDKIIAPTLGQITYRGGHLHREP